MALFGKGNDYIPPALAPLSEGAVRAVLDSREAKYRVDEDGDIAGYLEGFLFWFLRLGERKEILQVRGTWGRDVDLIERDRILELANTWNTEKLWPKVYVRIGDDGAIAVHSEHTVDYEHGATSKQLDQHLSCAISTSIGFFTSLDEVYPEAAAAAQAEFDEKD